VAQNVRFGIKTHEDNEWAIYVHRTTVVGFIILLWCCLLLCCSVCILNTIYDINRVWMLRCVLYAAVVTLLW